MSLTSRKSFIDLRVTPAGVVPYAAIEVLSREGEWQLLRTEVLTPNTGEVHYNGEVSTARAVRLRIYWSELLMYEYGPNLLGYSDEHVIYKFGDWND